MTDKLRAMLDERGIEHFDHENGEPLRDLSEAGADPATSWHMGDASVCAVPNKHGTFDLWIDNCTPEQAIAATVGAGTCRYIPDDAGFTWWDENDVEHYEEHSASDECCFASCDKCGNQMMVGEEGWFDGWDEITDWWEEDGSYHKGYVLEPRFKYCPNCGRRIVEEEAE